MSLVGESSRLFYVQNSLWRLEEQITLSEVFLDLRQNSIVENTEKNIGQGNFWCWNENIRAWVFWCNSTLSIEKLFKYYSKSYAFKVESIPRNIFSALYRWALLWYRLEHLHKQSLLVIYYGISLLYDNLRADVVPIPYNFDISLRKRCFL